MNVNNPIAWSIAISLIRFVMSVWVNCWIRWRRSDDDDDDDDDDDLADMKVSNAGGLRYIVVELVVVAVIITS